MGVFSRLKKPNWSAMRGRVRLKFQTITGSVGARLKQARASVAETKLSEINWSEKVQSVRKLSSSTAYGTYLRMAASAFAAYFLADTVSLFSDALIPDPPPIPAPRIRPKEENRKGIEEYAAIVSRNIFNSKGLIPEEEGGLANGPARKTNLPLNLIGTVVLQDELKSIAAIEDRAQNLVFPLRIDDKIENKIKVTKIEHLKVYFINQSTGHLEYVEILEDIPNLAAAVRPSSSLRKPTPSTKGAGNTGVTKTDETHFDVERTAVEKHLGNLSELLQQARAIPNFENGQPDGFRLLQIAPGSLYDQIGLKDNDVLCGINGESINDPGKAFQLFNELKTASHVEVCVKRSGRKMNLSYDIR